MGEAAEVGAEGVVVEAAEAGAADPRWAGAEEAEAKALREGPG